MGDDKRKKKSGTEVRRGDGGLRGVRRGKKPGRKPDRRLKDKNNEDGGGGGITGSRKRKERQIAEGKKECW